MDNTYINFGLMLGIWVSMNQIFDTYVTKIGHLEFASVWAAVVTLLVIGLIVAFYRKMKEDK